MSNNGHISGLHTEQVNTTTVDIDTLTTVDMLRRINDLDVMVPVRVRDELESIAAAVDLVVERFMDGGRLIYVGAGTSARLGWMDAAECPPTYGVAPDKVTCVMAGGNDAVFSPAEDAEDHEEYAVRDLKAFGLTSADVVMAIASSGRTPYCIGALRYAGELGAGRIALSCNKGAVMSRYAEVAIEVDTGPEAIMGSTRMKGGTAQKLVLNMISTTSMIKTGRVYKNLMVGTRGVNCKLSDRVIRIFSEATGNGDAAHARQVLEAAGGSVKSAIVMELTGTGYDAAVDALDRAGGFVREALRLLSSDEH